MLTLWVIALGGALGCVSRYGMVVAMRVCLGEAIPFGILFANILGSFLMGFLAILLIDKLHLSPLWRMGVLVGFLGGFTTFSSFSLDVVQMLQDGFWLKAMGYVGSSVVFGVLATFLGVVLASKLL